MTSPVNSERLRVAARALAPPGALDLHCERCQAFQCLLTDRGILAGGVVLKPGAWLTCAACGHEWRDRGGSS